MENPDSGNVKACRSRIVDPEERRRKILERSEERMRKILGRSSYIEDVQVKTKSGTEDNYNKVLECSPGEVKNYCLRKSGSSQSTSSDSSSWRMPFLFLLILLAFFIKVIIVLETFGVFIFGFTYSFVIPFFVVEMVFVIRKPAFEKMRAFGIPKSEALAALYGRKLNLNSLLKAGFSSLEDAVSHFSIYFVLLCLLHLL